MTSTCAFVSRAHSDFLKRNVAVFFSRIAVFLVFEGVQGGDDARARVGRFDDSVNVTAFRGDEGVCKPFAEFSDFFLTSLFALGFGDLRQFTLDRKSTRLNSSHVSISYAVFCLKK